MKNLYPLLTFFRCLEHLFAKTNWKRPPILIALSTLFLTILSPATTVLGQHGQGTTGAESIVFGGLQIKELTLHQPCTLVSGSWKVSAQHWVRIYKDGGENINLLPSFPPEISGADKTLAWESSGTKKPVAYASGAVPRISAKFAQDFTSNSPLTVSCVSNPIYVRALYEGKEMLNSTLLTKTTGAVYTLQPTKLNPEVFFSSFPKHRGKMVNFKLNWEWAPSLVLGPWTSFGQTTNTLYITREVPESDEGTLIYTVKGLPRMLTSIQKGCEATSATIEGQSDLIFKDFTDCDVKRVNSLKTMKYWGPDAPTLAYELNRNIRQFYNYDDGRCGEWSMMLGDILTIQGVKNKVPANGNNKMSRVLVRAYEPSYDAYSGAFTGNLSALYQAIEAKFPGEGFDPLDPVNPARPIYIIGANIGTLQVPVFKYQGFFFVKNWKNLPAAPEGKVYSVDENNDQGVRGQGNPEPPPYFSDHVFVKYNNNFFDPSYGSVNTTLTNWKTNSLTGAGVLIIRKFPNTETKNEYIYLDKIITATNADQLIFTRESK